MDHLKTRSRLSKFGGKSLRFTQTTVRKTNHMMEENQPYHLPPLCHTEIYVNCYVKLDYNIYIYVPRNREHEPPSTWAEILHSWSSYFLFSIILVHTVSCCELQSGFILWITKPLKKNIELFPHWIFFWKYFTIYSKGSYVCYLESNIRNYLTL